MVGGDQEGTEAETQQRNQQRDCENVSREGQFCCFPAEKGGRNLAYFIFLCFTIFSVFGYLFKKMT